MFGLQFYQANNGGWVVTDFIERGSGYVPNVLAACSNDNDLVNFIVSWLGGLADAKIAIAQKRESVTQ